VTVPELPGCRTHGRTYEEAVQQGKDAIRSWIEASRAWGDPIPPRKLWVCQISTWRLWCRLNVSYTDKQGQPVKQELEEKLTATLDYLQSAARSAETAVASDWSFMGILLFVEPHGAGKQ
jgi:HicB_like antitoxin of bacterial toxin-antitoxin system